MTQNKIPKHSPATNPKKDIQMNTSLDTHNKIPPEIEEKILKEVKKDDFYKYLEKISNSSSWGTYLNPDIFIRKAISLSFKAGQESKEHFIANRKESDFYNAGFKAGQTQMKNEVLKLINEWFEKCDDNDTGKGEKLDGWAMVEKKDIEELKAGVQNGKD